MRWESMRKREFVLARMSKNQHAQQQWHHYKMFRIVIELLIDPIYLPNSFLSLLFLPLDGRWWWCCWCCCCCFGLNINSFFLCCCCTWCFCSIVVFSTIWTLLSTCYTFSAKDAFIFFSRSCLLSSFTFFTFFNFAQNSPSKIFCYSFQGTQFQTKREKNLTKQNNENGWKERIYHILNASHRPPTV